MAVAAPAVFRFTAASNPQRHPEAAQAFGVDVSNARAEDAGELLGDALRNFLYRLGDQPRGIKTLGFARSDIEGIVDATLPQRRVLMIAPTLTKTFKLRRSASCWLRSSRILSSTREGTYALAEIRSHNYLLLLYSRE